jgi:AcrR family transcriptional regulator
MSAPGKRAYSSDLRADQARRTRKRIVDAAAALFTEQGFSATTIDAVAAAAGVSRKTVFTSVPDGKVGLLKLAYDFTIAGDDEPLSLMQRPGLQGVIAEPDPYRRYIEFAAFATKTNARIYPLHLALHGAAEVDADARALYQRWEVERRQIFRDGLIEPLVKQKALKPGLRPGEAADILFLLVSPPTYHRLVVECGWTPARYQRWLAETMTEQTLAPQFRH